MVGKKKNLKWTDKKVEEEEEEKQTGQSIDIYL